jgi:hypothetical protein
MEGDKILIPKVFDDVKVDKVFEAKADTAELVKDDDKVIEQPTPPPPEEPFAKPTIQKPSQIRDKNALYSAAVQAIAANTTRRRDRKLFLNKNSAAQSPGNATFSGIEVGGISNSIDLSPLEPIDKRTSSVTCIDINSVEESTVDSKVPSVDEVDGSMNDDDSLTHSSAIETPSDIDELSLGSFTDSEDEASKASNMPKIPPLEEEDPEEPTQTPPRLVSDAPAAEVTQSARTTPVTTVDVIQSTASAPTMSEFVDSDDSSSSKESSSSDSSSSSSSYTSSSSDTSDESDSSSSDENISNNIPEDTTSDRHETNEKEWVTRKETRFCHPLPKNLIFHLKRFEYSTALGRVEAISDELSIPEELELNMCSLDLPNETTDGELNACCHRYRISGAIVHVDRMESDTEPVYGEANEVHYVTFINKSSATNEKSNKHWFEIDDDKVNSIDKQMCLGTTEDNNQSLSQNQIALKILSGCDVQSSKEDTKKEKERRCAMMVAYSRVCNCCVGNKL